MPKTAPRAPRALLIPLFLALSALLLLSPDKTAAAFAESLSLCATVLLPALFPIFVLTSVVTTLLGEIPRRRSPLARLLALSADGELIFLLSLIAGFPHAAHLCKTAVESGRMTENEADRIIASASVPSLTFIVGAIGSGMLKNPALGVKLYLIQVACALLIALFLRLIAGEPPQNTPVLPPNLPRTPLLPLFSSAIATAAVAMLKTTAAVTFFAIVRSVLTPFLPRIPALVLSGLLEITSCAKSLTESLVPHSLTAALSLLLGFSGLSVHAQVALAASPAVRPRLLLPAKLLQALLACTLAFLIG